MAEKGLLQFVATMFGLRSLMHRMLGRAVETDLTIAGAVMQAEAFHEAEGYCRELDSSGQSELAAEIRRQLAALSTSHPTAGLSQEGPTKPPELPSPTPKELPPPQPERRKLGRPPKFRPPLPEAPANGQADITH